MFQVQNTIISSDVATVRFACDLNACKGACCVIGEAGAPVERHEMPVISRAFAKLKSGMRKEAVEVVWDEGLVKEHANGLIELNCTHGEACVFVNYTETGIAICEIQKAYMNGDFAWEKPISCHLFPIRIQRIGQYDYLNYQYIPSLCESACKKGEKEGIYLADFLKKPLIRKYGEEWYDEFRAACREVAERVEKSIL